VGLPAVLGGIPLDEIGATGWGILHAAEVAAAYCALDLRGARVVIQDFGAVGKHSARFLAERGAVLIGTADSQGTIHNAKGIDVAGLISLKDGGSSVCAYGDGRKRDVDAALDIGCDIWMRRDLRRDGVPGGVSGVGLHRDRGENPGEREAGDGDREGEGHSAA
jgi:glutamate dehydrogenase (NAD(P)+)